MNRHSLLLRACAIFIVLLLGSVLPLRAQQDRSVPVTVVDALGHTVAGLTAADFHGQLRGEQVEIRSAALQGGRRRVAVLVDVSAGIRNRPAAWDLAWQAASDFATTLRPPQLLGVFTFSSQTVFNGTAPAGQTGEISQALSRIEQQARARGGATALYDSIEAVAQREWGGGRADALYVISDGVDTTSAMKEKELARQLAASGTRVFFFLLPPEPGGKSGRDKPRFLAEASGGMVFDATAAPFVNGSFAALRPFYDAVVHYYVLDIELPHPLDKPREWSLTASGSTGAASAVRQVAYPRLLVP